MASGLTDCPHASARCNAGRDNAPVVRCELFVAATGQRQTWFDEASCRSCSRVASAPNVRDRIVAHLARQLALPHRRVLPSADDMAQALVACGAAERAREALLWGVQHGDGITLAEAQRLSDVIDIAEGEAARDLQG